MACVFVTRALTSDALGKLRAAHDASVWLHDPPSSPAELIAAITDSRAASAPRAVGGPGSGPGGSARMCTAPPSGDHRASGVSGRAVPRRVHGFDMTIRSTADTPLDEVLATRDFITMHCPLTPGPAS